MAKNKTKEKTQAKPEAREGTPSPPVVSEPVVGEPEPVVGESEPVVGESEPAAAGESQPVAAAKPKAEAIAELPHPRQLPDAPPTSAAPAPGAAPAGDSRSLRRMTEGTEEFCLVYRHYSVLVTRRGKVGVQGVWSIVEYPSETGAAHAYAQKCSDLTGTGGFSDYRL